MMNCFKSSFAILIALFTFTPSASTQPATSLTAPLPKEKITVGFSPAGTALDNILQAIASAKSDIKVAAYSFTSKKVACALITAKQKGVKIQVVADKKANGQKYTAVTFLANQGIGVRLNDHYAIMPLCHYAIMPLCHYAIMHNKFMIIDKKTVETGSFNYSYSADKKNAENVMVIWNNPDVAKLYSQEFQRLWEESHTKKPNLAQSTSIKCL